MTTVSQQLLYPNHYSPDSEAPIDVRSTHTSETEKYTQSPSFNNIDEFDSTKNDFTSDGLMRHNPHHDWQCNLNHPVDMPNKRQKLIHFNQFQSLLQYIWQSIKNQKRPLLQSLKLALRPTKGLLMLKLQLEKIAFETSTVSLLADARTHGRLPIYHRGHQSGSNHDRTNS